MKELFRRILIVLVFFAVATLIGAAFGAGLALSIAGSID